MAELLDSLDPRGVGLPYRTFQNLSIGFHCCLVIGGRSEWDVFTSICPTHKKTSCKKEDQKLFCTWLPLPTPGDLPDSSIELASSALTEKCFPTEPPGKLNVMYRYNYIWGKYDQKLQILYLKVFMMKTECFFSPI